MYLENVIDIENIGMLKREGEKKKEKKGSKNVWFIFWLINVLGIILLIKSSFNNNIFLLDIFVIVYEVKYY